VVLGGEGIVQAMTDNLAGANPDDEKTFIVDYPEDFSAKGLAGKRLEYAVKVSAVRTKEVPELDDEWAQSSGMRSNRLLILGQRCVLISKRKPNTKGKTRCALISCGNLSKRTVLSFPTVWCNNKPSIVWNRWCAT